MKIILNADDFGKSPGRNRAIHDSFEQGLITAAGMIVTGRYLQDAVRLANEGGYTDRLHVHFNLSTNQPKEGSQDAPLTDEIKNDPFFCRDGLFVNRGLPYNPGSILKWKAIYNELVAQYEQFKEVTEGRADYHHVDFHLWYNLTMPASIALNKLTRNYDIKTVRFCALHHRTTLRGIICRPLTWNPRVTYVPATNIDYFTTKLAEMRQYDTMELYCHPHYKDGIFLDDSPSYLKHERQPMMTNINALRAVDGIEYITWREYRQ